MVTITANLMGGRRQFPNGKPIKSELLPNGFTCHTMEDRRKFTCPPTAQYRLDYLSTFVGAKPGATYAINVCLAGACAIPGFYEVWNYDINEMRAYAFDKTVLLTDLITGDTVTGEDFRKQLMG